MTQAIPETSPPSTTTHAALKAEAPAAEIYTSTEDKKATVDASIAESVKKTNKVKAATKAPKGLLAQKHGNKNQVPWNKGLKLAKGGKRPTIPHNNTKAKVPTEKQRRKDNYPKTGGAFDTLFYREEPAEVRQFKSKFKKGTKYDEGFEAGYQEAIHDMAMILAAQVGRKQL